MFPEAIAGDDLMTLINNKVNNIMLMVSVPSTNEGQ
jgi:hypothetical protein